MEVKTGKEGRKEGGQNRRRLRSEDWTGCRRSKWAGKVVLVNGGWTGRR